MKMANLDEFNVEDEVLSKELKFDVSEEDLLVKETEKTCCFY